MYHNQAAARIPRLYTELNNNNALSTSEAGNYTTTTRTITTTWTPATETETTKAATTNLTNLTRLGVVEMMSNYTLNVLERLNIGNVTSHATTLPYNTVEAAYAIMSNSSHAFMNVAPSSSLDEEATATEHLMEHAPKLSRSGLIKVYVLSIMALFSLLGNVLTIWNIYKNRITRRNSRHTWSAIYALMFHLSIADVLVTGFCIIGEAAWCYTVQWLANELTCKMVKLFQMFSLYLSTYVLVLIGVDRWIAVKYPMKSLNMAKRCHRLLGGTYILSFVLSLPQFFIFRVARGPFVEEFHQCVTHGFYTAHWQEQLYATFTLVFTFLLPLCILFGTYMSTFRTISSSEKMFQGSKLATYSSTKPPTQTNRQRLIHKAKMKSLRISVVIIIAFLICWTPYYVMMIIFMFWNPDKRLGDDLQDAIFFFGMSNSLVNPLIYGAFHLCPSKNNKSSSNNNAYSLNRGDSQRTPSMLTAVTQVDGTGNGNSRQMRTFRQQSYYRTLSNGNSYKEQVSLLQVAGAGSPTPQLMRKAASVRSPHPNHNTSIVARHSSNLLRNAVNATANAADSATSTLVLNYDGQRGVGLANAKTSHVLTRAGLMDKHENVSSV